MEKLIAKDFDTAYQVLMNGYINDDYMRLCVEYEGFTKSNEIREELVYRYNTAKMYVQLGVERRTVELIRVGGHADYVIKVFEMFMDKPKFADISMRCLVTGKSTQQLEQEDALAAAEAKKKADARAAQIAEWKSKGLCTKCGGTINAGIFGKKCLSCKAKF
jgi:hypothetical protein